MDLGFRFVPLIHGDSDPNMDPDTSFEEAGAGNRFRVQYGQII